MVAAQASGNISPQLTWSNFPKATKSFAVSVYDPDAPTGSGFWHWLVHDLPLSTISLKTGAGAAGGAGLPKGAVTVANDEGKPVYRGPAPPKGQTHRYFITVYALDARTPGRAQERLGRDGGIHHGLPHPRPRDPGADLHDTLTTKAITSWLNSSCGRS